jgi:hypothetical protein
MEQKISNLGQAIGVLIQAAEMAQSKGVYSLKDSALIYDAVLFVEELNKANAPAEAVQSGEEPEQKLTPKGPTD